MRGKLQQRMPVIRGKGTPVRPMHVHPRNTPQLTRSALGRFVLMAIGAVVLLAGCGAGSGDADEEGHRFATERRPTTEVIATNSATGPSEEIPQTPVPTANPGEALDVRGAPRFAYLLLNDELVVYDTSNRAFQPIRLADGMQVMDFSGSPTGDRVGILAWQDGKVVVQFVGADGIALGDPIPLAIAWSEPSIAASTPAATPVSTGPERRLNINWIPQGNAVVVSGPGVSQRVSMNGAVMPISRTNVNGTVIEAIWSPMDSQVAMLTQMMDGHQGVFLLDSGHDEARELETLHLQPGQSISNVQWLPNGLGLMLVVGSTSDGDLMNGQLYIYRFGDEVPNLIATSAQGGPAATITHAAISPDGHAVAYVIMVRDLDEWHLHSLWVRPVRGGPGYSVPFTSNAPVTTLQWTEEGLVWQQIDGTVTVVDADLAPRPLGEAPQAPPVATPVASPQATPVELAPIG